ncbi:TetR/AcrR family transcriptional regulator [Actinopolymorpha cephalotaxi]|nr:TetR family transcriptional regulator C-terminal domain-containing protein [Actinopolymorpha cephalotaxi]NYH85669.1 AcrR family transcriptional regulator [Actinopolymorpha cephalotaxi]
MTPTSGRDAAGTRDRGGARPRVLAALMEIIAERGLDQATIREVAAGAGVSIGTVQYYCRSKDEMLQMAFEHVCEQILGRIRQIEGSGPGAAGGPDRTRGAGQGDRQVGPVLRRALLEFLPLDDRRRAEARVYLAFAARAAVSPDLAQVQQTMMADLRAMCAAAFQLAVDRGQAHAGLVPARAAAATTVMVDGLLLHLLTDPAGMPAKTATGIVDDHLARYVTVDTRNTVNTRNTTHTKSSRITSRRKGR